MQIWNKKILTYPTFFVSGWLKKDTNCNELPSTSLLFYNKQQGKMPLASKIDAFETEQRVRTHELLATTAGRQRYTNTFQNTFNDHSRKNLFSHQL